MLRLRTVTALVLAPVALAAILIGKAAVIAVVLLLIAGAAYELSRALNPLPFVAAFGAGTIPLLLSIPYGETGILAGAFLALPWSLLWLAGEPETRTVRPVMALLLMTLWVGIPLAHLRLFENNLVGVYLTMIAVVGPWVSDSGGYFAGRFLGRHLLFPAFSPKKTVEGAIGGLLLTVLTVTPFCLTLLDYPLGRALAVGAGVSVASQSGDLFESALKRILDVKDLGNFLPGHGGVLDRVDSLLFTVPAVYYISLLV